MININNNIYNNINNIVEQSYTDNQLSGFFSQMNGNFNAYNQNMGNQQGNQILFDPNVGWL